MKKLNKNEIFDSVSKIIRNTKREDITSLFYGDHKRIYSVNPNNKDIQEIIITGATLERDCYSLKVRIKDSQTEDAFFAGDKYYNSNKKIFNILNKEFSSY
jgi:hypothetical protein